MVPRYMCLVLNPALDVSKAVCSLFSKPELREEHDSRFSQQFVSRSKDNCWRVNVISPANQ